MRLLHPPSHALGTRALAVALLRCAGPALAAEWVADHVEGAVLQLVGGEWRELRSGDMVAAGAPIRTLGRSALGLRSAEGTVRLGANTTVQLRAGEATVLQHYAGEIAVEAADSAPRIFVQTTTMNTAIAGGAIRVRVTGSGARLDVERGSASAASPGNPSAVVVNSGQSLTAEGTGALGPVVDSAPAVTGPAAPSPFGAPTMPVQLPPTPEIAGGAGTPGGAVPAVPSPVGPAEPAAPGNSGGGNSGGGNAGGVSGNGGNAPPDAGNGNSGGNRDSSNGNENAGGNGNSSAGGNGNSNSNSGGNGNSGNENSGNGNAGGNGNGNGNGRT